MRLRNVTITAMGALTALAIPSGATAATTIGQDLGGGLTCTLAGTALQDAVVTGNGYTIPPGGGVVTSWNTAMTGGVGTLVVASRSADPNKYTLTDLAADQTLPGSFATRLSVDAGQIIGIRLNNANVDNCIVLGNPGDKLTARPNGGVPNVLEEYTPIAGDGLVNVSAKLEADTDLDGFGDETQDAFFTKTPKAKTKSTKATFAFTGAASFQCRLDKGDFKPCSSPKKLRKLKVRKHKFRVHAVTPGGEFSPDTTFSWRVQKK